MISAAEIELETIVECALTVGRCLRRQDMKGATSALDRLKSRVDLFVADKPSHQRVVRSARSLLGQADDAYGGSGSSSTRALHKLERLVATLRGESAPVSPARWEEERDRQALLRSPGMKDPALARRVAGL